MPHVPQYCIVLYSHQKNKTKTNRRAKVYLFDRHLLSSAAAARQAEVAKPESELYDRERGQPKAKLAPK